VGAQQKTLRPLSSEIRLSGAVQGHFGTRVQVLFAVAEFHTVNGSAFTGKVELSRFSAGANSLGIRKLLLRAISEVNDHALKLNRTASHSQLDAVKLPRFTSHMNSFVIFAFVDMSRTEHYPMLGMRDRRHYGKNEQHT
jgi:hypothetical protein